MAESPEMTRDSDPRGMTRVGRIATLTLFIVGTLLCALALAAELLNLDFTPGFGVVQMFQLLVGLSMLTISGFWHIRSLRPVNPPPSLQADIAVRIALTGLLFALAAGMSDLLRIGTHVAPRFDRPYVGPLQLAGIVVGIVAIVLGMWLYYTSRGTQSASSLEFLLQSEARQASAAGTGTNGTSTGEAVSAAGDSADSSPPPKS